MSQEMQQEMRREPPPDSRGNVPLSGYDADGRLRDALGRVQPSRFNWIKFMRAVPGLFTGPERAFDRDVPSSFYTAEVKDGVSGVVIACPCGNEPFVPQTKCVECDCERFYLNVGRRVLVANSPAREPVMQRDIDPEEPEPDPAPE